MDFVFRRWSLQAWTNKHGRCRENGQVAIARFKSFEEAETMGAWKSGSLTEVYAGAARVFVLSVERKWKA